MDYRIIGLMSGSSLDGLDIAFVEFSEAAGSWTFAIREADCISYPADWRQRLGSASALNARDYLLLDAEYGRYTAGLVNEFIAARQLEHRVQLIASHGHTVFHIPEKGMTAQLGNPAAIAALTGIPVIADLRSGDVSLGGQGAPLVPIGEQLLFPDYHLFLNLGGIANMSARGQSFHGFDVCPANRILNLLAESAKGYDEDGMMAESGNVDQALLNKLNAFEYYQQPFPKSLSNQFGLDVIYPAIKAAGLSKEDALSTYTEHICVQLLMAVKMLFMKAPFPKEILVTGGGAANLFLVRRLQVHLQQVGIEVIIPDKLIVDFKEALIMALIGALRWRDEVNILSAVTGAKRDHTGGAIWSS